MKILSVIFIIFCLSGCVGTVTTRMTSKSGSFIGAYPYQAVYQDIDFYKEENESLGKAYLIFIFLPLDAIFDTILLPPDLIAWPFGKKKKYDYIHFT